MVGVVVAVAGVLSIGGIRGSIKGRSRGGICDCVGAGKGIIVGMGHVNVCIRGDLLV